MADAEDKASRTEAPTAKRLSKAYDKGDVAKSAEVSHWFALSATAIVILAFADLVFGGISDMALRFIERPHDIVFEPLQLYAIFQEISLRLALLLALPVAVLVLASLASVRTQHPFIWAREKIKLDFPRLLPTRGWKKLFNVGSVVELAKAIFKFSVVMLVAALVVWPVFNDLELIPSYDPQQVLVLIKRIALLLLLAVISVMTVIAALDLAFQRWRWMENQKMTKREVQDERKQSEGDPKVKARIRSLRLERHRARLAAVMPSADVVLTNPTHYAVALKYKDATMAAPKVIAKGVDHLALRIRELAEEHNVPIVCNPPLARAIYANVDLDQEIPAKFYQAVAEVISYVMQLKSKLERQRSATGIR